MMRTGPEQRVGIVYIEEKSYVNVQAERTLFFDNGIEHFEIDLEDTDTDEEVTIYRNPTDEELAEAERQLATDIEWSSAQQRRLERLRHRGRALRRKSRIVAPIAGFALAIIPFETPQGENREPTHRLATAVDAALVTAIGGFAAGRLLEKSGVSFLTLIQDQFENDTMFRTVIFGAEPTADSE